MEKKAKKVAAIHDLSGIGRCSLTAAIPIISALGIQVCPFPTAILSCQTGYPSFSFLDLTDEMVEFKDSWREMNFNFQGIYSGFLGSARQIDIVKDFVENNAGAFILIDPVMGDNGKIYKTYTDEMCLKMRELVKLADVVTPNLTEACILTGRNYHEFTLSMDKLNQMAKEISSLGPEKVVITGIVDDGKIYNFGYDKTEDKSFVESTIRNEVSFSGTGDMFASIICGMLLNGRSFEEAVKKATEFIYEAIKYSMEVYSDNRNGVIFEPLLRRLMD